MIASINRILATAFDKVALVHVPGDGDAPSLNAYQLLGIRSYLDYPDETEELMGHDVFGGPDSDLAKSCKEPDIVLIMLPDCIGFDEDDHANVRLLFYFLRQQVPDAKLAWVADSWIYDESRKLRGKLDELLDQPEQNSCVVLLPGADDDQVGSAVEECQIPKSVAIYDLLLGRGMRYLIRWICTQLDPTSD